MKQVGVHLLQSNATFDIEYTYLVHEALIESGKIIRGSFVNVPFGKRKKLQTAVVWTMDSKSLPGIELKEISSISDVRPPLTQSEMWLASKMSKMYFCSISACVRCMIPPPAPTGQKVNYAKLNINHESVNELATSGQLKNIIHIRLLENLKEGRKKVSDLAKETGCSSTVINTLVKKGYIIIEKDIAIKSKEKNHEENENIKQFHTYDKQKLNNEQQKAFDYIKNLINKKTFAECLLHGVTGSGKTEIYMQLIQDIIKDGGSALLLVPEISLTPQMTAHFQNRFGNNVAVLHSRLSDAERNAQWNKIKNSEVSVAIGARSAIFAPFENLSIIILDEEHENSYKSEESAPGYHAAEIAKELAKIKNAIVVYGSATPRTETYFRAKQKDIHYISLTKRANNAPLPQVEIVDMKEERERGGIGKNGIFSKLLTEEMKKNYKEGKQTMLFVHRRGHSKQLMCKNCGKIIKCYRCNMPMTYHEKGNRMICHHCGRTFPTPEYCQNCGANDFEKWGIGTQKVAQEISKMFPDATVVRMDTDTTSIKNGHEQLLAEFSSGKAQFLVGTQMIAKGHDFPNVTLVGTLLADSLINMPDFRAQERAFQLFTQMAGRAGRGAIPGKVIIQAYSIDDYSLTAACNHDYEEFYKNEIIIREALNYPPFSAMCVLRYSGEDDRETYRIAREFCGKILSEEKNNDDETEVLGPARADVPKVNNKYRWLITIKGKNREQIISFLQKNEKNIITNKNKSKATVLVSFYGR